MTREDRIDVLGVGFDNLSMSEAIDRAMKDIAEHKGGWVVTPNPEIVLECRKNEAMARAVKDAALVIADGIGVIYASKILGRPLREKIPGIDFACGLLQRLSEHGGRAYLFGAKPGVAEAAAETLRHRFPGLDVCGTHDGYFQDDAPIVADIQAKKPDLLLVCLGAPKQELWMETHSSELDVGTMIGLGGSLDVFAGTAQRAPEGLRRLGLEWLYRLFREPRRIKRMIRLPLVLLFALNERVFGKRKK